MTDASLPTGRFTSGEFRVGQVLSRTWSVFSDNVLKFSVATGIAMLPLLLIFRLSVANPLDAAGPLANRQLISWAGILMLLLNLLAEAFIFYGTFQHLRRSPIILNDGARVSFRCFFPLIGLGLVWLVVLFGLLFITGLLFVVPGVRYATPLMIILFAMLFLMWSMAAPVCVVERAGPFRSLGRSRELTKGHRWKILGLFLLVLISGLIVGLVIGVIFRAIVGLAPADGFRIAATQTVSLIWNAMWSAFFAVTFAVAYHDLRVAKEGVDTNQIAAIFE